jgi:glycoprotein-N-acetylgalactosamine 3-beta-galactosyltransferase
LEGLEDITIVHEDTRFNATHKHGYKEGRLWHHVVNTPDLFDRFDWFFKADDDSYVIHENVVRFLSKFDSNNAHFFGRAFRADSGLLFPAGGAGYALSIETLRLVKADHYARGSFLTCASHMASFPSDTMIAECLLRFSIALQSSQSSLDAGNLFHPFNHHSVFSVYDMSWLNLYSFYGLKGGRACCQKHSLSFHYMGW